MGAGRAAIRRAVATRATDAVIAGVSTALVGGDIQPMLDSGTLPMKFLAAGRFDPQRDASLASRWRGKGAWPSAISPR